MGGGSFQLLILGMELLFSEFLGSQEFGRGARVRTGGLLLPKQARYQAAPRPDGVAQKTKLQ